jgi:hypothetical protein
MSVIEYAVFRREPSSPTLHLDKKDNNPVHAIITVTAGNGHAVHLSAIMTDPELSLWLQAT